MKFVYLLFLFLSELYTRVECIYNGNFISIKESPYYVALIDEEHWSYCGGAILSEHWIITAAHCIYDDDVLADTVRVGETTKINNRSLYKVEKVYVHGDFYRSRGTVLDSDIALIKLKNPLQFNEYQQPIRITSEPPKAGDTLLLTGLGRQGKSRGYSRVLKKTEMTVLKQSQCEQLSAPYSGHPTNNVFCARATDKSNHCPGDSGGPAVIGGKLAGIVTWGFDCSDKTLENWLPAYYTRVHKFYDWIIKTTGIKY